ncbi:thiamine phosphate synthase [Acetobacter ghanensis]|uniref:Thiamine phosphate synthase n=1 Tax=Acetobacter ghanensis TaxID=431306 RepID=A0A0U5F5Q4_9PROT|nr:thiamine phosphate synthase [Acetobacter ghanensis]NHO39370.1 thiamine phosphate synthase [Acetobacter ghanensis]GBQ47868.1 thiamine phosphate pyrophosphorylase [Acetobacter ghanensis DSM 18895]CEF54442.1 thiamine-phosphate pyrophosphorylase [Acetobacter ghanensis]
MSELYLVTPPLLRADAFVPVLEKRLAHYQPAALLLRLADGVSAVTAKAIIGQISPLVQHKGIALMLEDAPDLAVQTGCDGVHLSPSYVAASVREVRRQIGDELQLGVAVGTSRDVAMRAGEEGADYICFAPDADDAPDAPQTVQALAQWWCMMMELPAVAQARTPEEAAALVGIDVDFVMPAASWWDDPALWSV